MTSIGSNGPGCGEGSGGYANDIEPDWYASAFDVLYPVLYAHRDAAEAREEAEMVVDVLGIRSSDSLLDLCCGAGRHLLYLKQAAGCCVGVDFSRALLSKARRKLERSVRLVRADMRALPFVRAFDVGVNFFTSFGYFLDERENRQAAAAFAHALKPGGRFLIDYFNALHTQRHLVPSSRREAGPYEVREERWIDQARRRVNKRTWVYRQSRLVNESAESVRLYHEDEFRALLADVGLEVDRVFGGFDGGPLTPEQPRMIAIGHRIS